MRKTKILSIGALLGGLVGSAIGFFSPTAVHFPAIVAIYAVLFCVLGVGVSAVAWMITRSSEEREEGKRREEQFQDQTRQAASGGASILGGVALMIVASAWFTIGLTADTVFLYPPILFVIGLIAFIRGILSGGTRIESQTEPQQNGG